MKSPVCFSSRRIVYFLIAPALTIGMLSVSPLYVQAKEQDSKETSQAKLPPKEKSGKADSAAKESAANRDDATASKAEEAKEGPVLITDDGEHLWIDAVRGWPRGKRVKVSGQVRVKHDRPVFVPQPGQPIAAGVPVPAGTDLRAASQRLLIGAAQWTTVD